MINRMVLQGRMVADPELRRTQSGTSVCSFTVAWSETVKERETSLFLDCVAWQGTAEMLCKYFCKGKELVVEGRLTSRTYEDKAGNKRKAVELVADKIHFCGKKDDAAAAPSYSTQSYNAPAEDKYRPAGRAVDVSAEGFSELDEDDDLPF